MRTDMPAEIWLDPYRWEALQEILEQDGTDIEEVLQNYLIEVYSDRVPIERQKEVDRRIKRSGWQRYRKPKPARFSVRCTSGNTGRSTSSWRKMAGSFSK